MCKTGGFLFPVKVTRFVSKSFFTPCGVCAFFQLSAKTICGAPRSTPRLLSFHEESNQRRAKEEVSSLDSPLRGTSPRELRKRSSLPLSAPPASKCQVLHLLLRKVSGYIVANSFLGAWGFKRGLPLSLEFQKPGGFWCALCETFFTQESFRGCGLRKPAIDLIKSSEKEQRSFSCPHHLKLDFAESPSAGLCRDYPAKNKKFEKRC